MHRQHGTEHIMILLNITQIYRMFLKQVVEAKLASSLIGRRRSWILQALAVMKYSFNSSTLPWAPRKDIFWLEINILTFKRNPHHSVNLSWADQQIHQERSILSVPPFCKVVCVVALIPFAQKGWLIFFVTFSCSSIFWSTWLEAEMIGLCTTLHFRKDHQ